MIAKITRGATVGGLAAYLHGPGRANEHVYDGRVGGAVIGGTLGAEGSRDGRGWAADMQSAITARPEVKGPVWHMSLRCAPGDRILSDAGWRHAAQMMGERMGWADRPWVMVRHGEDHVHIVVSRVGWDRSLWQARNDRRAAQDARRVVERELGLMQAPIRRETSKSLTAGEHSRALRTGAEPPRHDLAGRVKACASAATGLGRATFEDLLTAQGVGFRANVAGTGRVSGYSFALSGHTDAQGDQVWWKGSQLDRSLSWKTLGETLSAPLPAPRVEVPPKRVFERRGVYEQRVETIRREAAAGALARRRQGAFQVAQTARVEAVNPRRTAWVMRARMSERAQIPAKRDALGRRVKVGDLPIGHLTVESIEGRRLAELSHPKGRGGARDGQVVPGRRIAGRVTSVGMRAVGDVARDQVEGRNRNRGLGR